MKWFFFIMGTILVLPSTILMVVCFITSYDINYSIIGLVWSVGILSAVISTLFKGKM